MASKLTKPENLSLDAWLFACSMFAFMQPKEGELTFRMKESRPSDRSQAALDELSAAGLVSSEPYNQFGGITYRPLVAFPRLTLAQADQMGKWPVVTPISEAS